MLLPPARVTLWREHNAKAQPTTREASRILFLDFRNEHFPSSIQVGSVVV